MTLNHLWRKFWPSAFNTDDATTVVSRADVVWQMLPAGVQLIGDAGPTPSAWKLAGLAYIVKDGTQRTISRVKLPRGTVFVKQIRPNSPRAWVREMLRPSKGRLEFENAVALRKLGIACVEPLALGEANSAWPGESFIITRALADVEAFDTFLESRMTAECPVHAQALRRQLARELARFIAAMHDSGVAHPDPHPGNFLVEVPANCVPRFTLLDVHAVRFGAPLTWEETRENLVLLNRWFQMRATRTDRLRFWKAYLLARSTLRDDNTQAKIVELETATLASNLRFWNGRNSRYLGTNRLFRRIKQKGVRAHRVHDFPDDLVRQWMQNPDAIFASQNLRMLKDSRTSTVAEVALETPNGTQRIIVKRFNLRSRFGFLKNLLRPSSALRSWLNGHQLLDRGIATARPLVLIQQRKYGISTTGYVVFEAVPDAHDISSAFLQSTSRCEKNAHIERIADLVRTMHERGVSHRDLKAPNILLNQEASPVLIDLVGVRTYRSITRKVLVRDLARLNLSFHNAPAVSRADRLRFLRCYLRWNLRGKHDWKSWWRAIAQVTEVKVEQHIQNQRPIA